MLQHRTRAVPTELGQRPALPILWWIDPTSKQV
jgi:hypothetical protein